MNDPVLDQLDTKTFHGGYDNSCKLDAMEDSKHSKDSKDIMQLRTVYVRGKFCYT